MSQQPAKCPRTALRTRTHLAGGRRPASAATSALASLRQAASGSCRHLRRAPPSSVAISAEPRGYLGARARDELRLHARRTSTKQLMASASGFFLLLDFITLLLGFDWFSFLAGVPELAPLRAYTEAVLRGGCSGFHINRPPAGGG